MTTIWKILIVLMVLQISVARDKIRDDIFKFIFENYEKKDLPYDSNQTRVMVYIKVLAIDSVNVSNMDYSTDIYLRQQWQDPRLRWDDLNEFKHFESNIVTPMLKDMVWLPDLFFRNGKAGYVHNMTTTNYLMRLQPNGELLYSQKITVGFSCQMNLQRFPMDTQHCDMNIGSYGYTLDQLKFYWRKTDALVMADGMQIPEFTFPEDVQTLDCTEDSTTSTGAYSCLKAVFALERQLGSYLVGTFIPNSLIVAVSWLNFWISVDASAARIPLGLLTLLGILTQASGTSKNLPRVSYIKAIDVWTIACILFVIGTLIEFAFASTALQKQKARRWKKDVIKVAHEEIDKLDLIFNKPETRKEEFQGVANDFDTLYIKNVSLKYYDKLNQFRKGVFSSDPIESTIDKQSRFIFPMCFILYNVFYWSYYLVIPNVKAKFNI